MKESKLVLGTVQFGLKYGIANTGDRVSAEEVRRILSSAFERGIRVLDTAAAYGESERVLGRELANLGLTGKMRIISKVAPMAASLTESEAESFIFNSIESSLKNLGIDTLDALLFHREADLKYLKYLRKAVDRGLIRAAGASLDGGVPDEAYECDAVQVPGNVLDRRFLSFIRKAHSRGTRIYNRSVYLQGLLLMPEERIPEPLKGVVKYRHELESLAEKTGISPAELYVRYLFSIPEIDGVLTGVDTAEQLKYNCDVADSGALDDSVMDEILRLVPELPEYMIRPSIWGANKWV